MLTIGHGELGERQRVLLSIAERAGAVELEPGGHDGLLVTLTGRGSPRDGPGRDPGIAQPRLGVLPLDRALQLRRTDVPPAPDPRALRRPRARARPSGRCCDVCDPDGALRAGAARDARRAPAARVAVAAVVRRALPVQRARAAAAEEEGLDRSTSASSTSCGRGGWRARKASRRTRSRPTRPCGRCCAGGRGASRRCSRSGASGRRSARSTASRCWRRWRCWALARARARRAKRGSGGASLRASTALGSGPRRRSSAGRALHS